MKQKTVKGCVNCRWRRMIKTKYGKVFVCANEDCVAFLCKVKSKDGCELMEAIYEYQN